MNIISREIDRVRQAKTETIPLMAELKNRNFALIGNLIKQEGQIRDLKEEVADLEEEVAAWEEKSDPYEGMEQAIRYFCQECPLKGSLSCWTCYLNRWKRNSV